MHPLSFSLFCRVNPDNVATPIAASLGDLVTLSLLSWIASLLYNDHSKAEGWLAPLIVGLYSTFNTANVTLDRE